MLREIIGAASDGEAVAEEAMALASLLLAKGDVDARREALSLYRRVASRAPLTAVGKDARRRAELALAALPTPVRKALSQWPAEELFREGQALLNARRYADAETLYGKLADRFRPRSTQRCQALLKKARALELQRKRNAAALLFVSVARACKDTDTKAWARYYAGQTLMRTGKPRAAIAQLDALARELPGHRLADDALYKAATAAEDADGPRAKAARLSALVERYPRGDMRSAARFELAQNAFTNGDLTQALGQLDRLIDEGPGEIYEGMHGRALYWRARVLQRIGRLEEAKTGYDEVAQTYPLTYYAQQAMARLGELDAARLSELISALRDREPETPLTFAYRKEMQTPEFARALELLRVGDLSLAKKELAALGAFGVGADKSWSWLTATMLHFAGDHTTAIHLAGQRLSSFSTTVPKGKARFMWRVAFPRAYAPLIEETAAAAGISPALLRAVAREESRFDPQSVSSANAYGLVQLIVPTARQNARALGLPSDPESLKRPEINLRIGAEFIRFLSNRYPGNAAVIPAAYNAGYVATDRWLQKQSGNELDAWVELIPYTETRNYTRRVLQSYGIYSWLDTGTLPSLPRALPPEKAQPR
jgi:soluble lytic murein transglycosylase